VLKKAYDGGERKFFIFGESDLVSLVEMAMRELALVDCVIERIKDLPSEEAEGTIFICQEDGFDKVVFKKKIDLIHELAKGHVSFNQNV
jgi:hypothetical protein